MIPISIGEIKSFTPDDDQKEGFFSANDFEFTLKVEETNRKLLDILAGKGVYTITQTALYPNTRSKVHKKKRINKKWKKQGHVRLERKKVIFDNVLMDEKKEGEFTAWTIQAEL